MLVFAGIDNIYRIWLPKREVTVQGKELLFIMQVTEFVKRLLKIVWVADFMYIMLFEGIKSLFKLNMPIVCAPTWFDTPVNVLFIVFAFTVAVAEVKKAVFKLLAVI